jgi:signal transduction histidine kinase
MKSRIERPAGGSLSLERKLPLTITALLVVTLAMGVVFAYTEVKRTSVGAAQERLHLVSVQLADLIRVQLGNLVSSPGQNGARPAILRFLEAPVEANRAEAEGSLRAMRGRGGADLPIVLRARTGRTLAILGRSPELAAADSGRLGPAMARALPDTVGVSPFVVVRDSAYYWTVLPVRRGRETLGTIAQLRAIGGAATARQVQVLLGSDISVYFANTGDSIWVALDGRVVRASPDWPFRGASRHRHGADGTHLSDAAPIDGTPWSMVAEEPVAAVMVRPSRFLESSAVAALLLSLVGALGVWLVSRSITRPIRTLRLAAESIARGDYSRRSSLRRSDELGVLSESFNWMAAQVEATHEELQQQYETAQSLAVELERSNEQLEIAIDEARAARDDAEGANRAKSEFLATMSHEIRTPINAVIGYTELLQLELAGPMNREQRSQLERIAASGNHLIGLVDQVLDFARIEAGTLRVESRPASAAEAVELALTVVGPQAAQKGVDLSTECTAERNIRYQGDPQRVHQVLVNLLANAVKFTDAGGRITVECTSRTGRLPGHPEPGCWICLVVEDTGIGIPPEQVDHIFQPFVQVESGYTRRHGGTGLGLAISRRLAVQMGGDLTVESSPAWGSRFTLWLPQVPA